MKKIAIDLHDTIAGYMSRFVEIYGYPYRWTGDLQEMYPKSLLDEHFSQLNHSWFLETLRPYKHASRVLWKLVGMNGGKWEPFILTATKAGGPDQRTTMRWLTKWMFPPNLDIVFAGSHKGKVDYMIANKINYLVDDLPKVINPAVKMGIEVVVFNAPWNQQVELPHYRVETWDALAAYLGVDL